MNSRLLIFSIFLFIVLVRSDDYPDLPGEHPCGTTWNKLWLDIVFIVDVSAGMTNETLARVASLMKNLMKDTTIGVRRSPYSTRVGFITYDVDATLVADLDAYSSYEEFAGNVTKTLSKVSVERDSYMASGLDMVSDVFKKSYIERRKHSYQIAILIAASYDSFGDDPQAEAQSLKDEGVRIMTLGTTDSSYLADNLDTMAFTTWYIFNMADSDPIEGMQWQLMHVNCRCPGGWDIFKYEFENWNSPTYGTCVKPYAKTGTWHEARDFCSTVWNGATIVNAMSAKKHDFVYNVVTKENRDIVSPYRYHIGLSFYRGNWRWEGLNHEYVEAEFTYWNDGFPITPFFNYSAVVAVPAANNTRWENINLTTDQAYFVCEMMTCDTDNACFPEQQMY